MIIYIYIFYYVWGLFYMKKIIIITVVIFIVAVLARFMFYQYSSWQSDKRLKSAKALGVVTKVVETRDVIKKYEAPARIQSVSRIDVVARISGYLVKSYFHEGDIVQKGQILFEIESQEYKLAVDKAKASLDNSEAQLRYYEKQLVRATELVKKDYISKAKYDETLSQRDSYKAQVELNTSAYKDALRNYSYTQIKAPVTGQVGMLKVTVGNYVTPATGALTTLNSVDPIYVTFPLDIKNYNDLLRVDKSAYVQRQVDLYFSSSEKYNHVGMQDFHDNNVDPTTGSIMMRATFPNPDGLLINGNYATVYIYSKSKENMPVVPTVSVMENPQTKYVYKIDEKGLPQIQNITTYGQDGQDWIIKDGLKAGDRIIVTGLQKVIPGEPVRELTKEEIDAMTAKNELQTEKKSVEKNVKKDKKSKK